MSSFVVRRGEADLGQLGHDALDGDASLLERVFLSYTFRSHPDHEAELERLRKYVVRAIEAMGCVSSTAWMLLGQVEEAVRAMATEPAS